MNRTSKGKLLWQLFSSMFYLSAFTFGGGYVIITLMKNKFVDKYHWLEETEMLDLTALAQSAPGAIAVNASILVGWRLAGLVGMLTAVIATVLPPLLVLSVISLFYAAFAANPKSIEDYKAGKQKAFGFLVGQTMKELKGKADPKVVNEIIREKLETM